MAATVADILSEGAGRLAAVTETPRLDAEMLLAHAMGLSRASLLARLREPADTSGFEVLLARRLNYEPLAYIFGEWEFFGLPMYVVPPLLTPRPETEHLVECALDFLFGQSSPCVAVDVCCGTGCVGVAIARNAPGHRLYAVDLRRDAVETTRRNAARHGVFLEMVQGDLVSAFSPQVDIIVANPPYVSEDEWRELSPVITRHEDPGALLAGKDGLDCIRQLVPGAARCLRPGGMLVLEIGDTQSAVVAELLAAHGFYAVECRRDLAGIQRVISGLRS